MSDERCEHDWRADDSGVVLDMGPDGIRSGYCVKCGARGQLGPVAAEGWRAVKPHRTHDGGAPRLVPAATPPVAEPHTNRAEPY